jgi:hypothetical protein
VAIPAGCRTEVARTSPGTRADLPRRLFACSARGYCRTLADPTRPERTRTDRTDEAHHCLPPWAVGTRSTLRLRAISPRLFPASCAARILRTTSGGTAGGRPRVEGGAWERKTREARRRMATNRSSSSTGMRRVPDGISRTSTNGRMRRSNVDRLMPSASAAWLRVYASRSTRFACRRNVGSCAGTAS